MKATYSIYAGSSSTWYPTLHTTNKRKAIQLAREQVKAYGQMADTVRVVQDATEELAGDYQIIAEYRRNQDGDGTQWFKAFIGD